MDNLDDIFNFVSDYFEIKAAMIVSTEGLPIASVLPQDVDETKMAAITAPLLLLAKKAVIEMERGEFTHLIISGDEGNLLVFETSPNTVAIFSVTKSFRSSFSPSRINQLLQKVLDFLNNYIDATESRRIPKHSYKRILKKGKSEYKKINVQFKKRLD